MTVPPVRCLPDAELPTAPGRVVSGRMPPLSASAEIAGLQWLSGDVIRLSLALPADTEFDYQPGQYLAIASEDGRRRCFSMAAPPAGGQIELHIRHWPGGRFSHWLAEGAKLGDRIGIEGPYGNFIWRSQQASGAVLLATGTGIAPIIALLTRALDNEAAALPIRLYWGVRRHADLYRALLFRRWEKLYPRFVFIPVVSQRDGAAADPIRVQDLALDELATLRGVDVYACGSPHMGSEARAKFLARSDFSPERFFGDAFTAADTPALPAPATPAIGLRLRQEASFAPIEARIGETLLVALKRAGLPLLAVCGGQASCGTCKVAIADAWGPRLPPPSKVERNLLACLPDSKAGDRLACQIILTAELDGLELCPSG
jgi:CDP-4-dehydro-6-deoxyglucose reductase